MGRNKAAYGNSTLGSFTSAVAGTAVPLTTYLNSTFFVRGTFVATILLEGSDDGTNFVTLKDVNGNAISLTAPGAVNVCGMVPSIRARCSAFTSGTAVAVLAAASTP